MAARNRVTQMEDHLRMGRQSLQELREQRSHAEVDEARNDSDRQHLRETCMAEVNAQPEDLIATETAFMSGEELATAETNYREMKQRIENMGAVNMMALEEFNECEQRFTFLTRERDDLLQSITDTQQAIKELDPITKERFEQAFTAINKNFRSAFHTIFGGGMAEMRLTEADSSGDAGIDIVASPPGKRLQNILLLSRRREGDDRAGAADRDFPLPAEPVLYSGRGGCAAGRSQRGPLHAADWGDERADAIHHRDAQSQDDGDRQRAVWRDHAGAGRFQTGERALGRRRSAQEKRKAATPRPKHG